MNGVLIVMSLIAWLCLVLIVARSIGRGTKPGPRSPWWHPSMPRSAKQAPPADRWTALDERQYQRAVEEQQS